MFVRVYISNYMGHYYMYMYLSEANCMVNIYTTCLLVYIYLIAWVIIICICTCEANCMVNIYKTCLLVCVYILCNTHYIGSPQSNIRTAGYIMQRYAENERS